MINQFNQESENILKIIDLACKNDNCSIDDLQQLYNKYFGSNGIIRTKYLSKIKDLPTSEKKTLGVAVNILNKQATKLIKERQEFLKEFQITKQIQNEVIDLTLEQKRMNYGSIHPLNLIIYEVHDFFSNLGYNTVEWEEIDTDEFNFERLNIPQGHPARETQDTFFIDEVNLMRTHCTNATAHVLKTWPKNQPLRVVSTGNVYRKDNDDATHSHQFCQIDVVNLGQNISLANLKWTLEKFVQWMFSEGTEIRMRPSFFPFTEPSLEVDVTCFHCNGKGCSVCKKSGWIEILGAGMLHPNVISQANHSPEKIQGFAFGIGVERIAMIKYKIKDIRYFYNNNIRFLNQFRKFS